MTIFLTPVFSKQNGISVKLSNIITSSQLHIAWNIFANKNVEVMINPGCNAFCVTSDKQIEAHFKYCQIKTHVQTACESHDLYMDFRSFDNGFKQLCVANFMQEYIVNVLKCQTLFSFVLSYQGWNLKSSCLNSKQGRA